MVDIAAVEKLIEGSIEEAEKDPNFGGQEIVRFAVDEVKRELGVECIYEYCGGFDSPGYTIDCYAIAYSTDVGDIGIYSYQHEIY